MPVNPGLPQPPDRRQLPPSRISPVRTLLARYRAAAAQRTNLPKLPTSPLPSQRKPPVPGQKYRPPKEDKTWTSSPRDILTLISRYAQQRQVLIIRYRKKATGEVVTRSIEPYSLRYKVTRRGERNRYLYAYCIDGPTVGIHSFLLGNILSVQATDTTYRPRWKVEF
jgi:hypothetical protein